MPGPCPARARGARLLPSIPSHCREGTWAGPATHSEALSTQQTALQLLKSPCVPPRPLLCRAGGHAEGSRSGRSPGLHHSHHHHHYVTSTVPCGGRDTAKIEHRDVTTTSELGILTSCKEEMATKEHLSLISPLPAPSRYTQIIKSAHPHRLMALCRSHTAHRAG